MTIMVLGIDLGKNSCSLAGLDMRFVPVKSVDQQAALLAHKARKKAREGGRCRLGQPDGTHRLSADLDGPATGLLRPETQRRPRSPTRR